MHVVHVARAEGGTILEVSESVWLANRYRPHASIGYIAATGPAAPYIDAVTAVHVKPIRTSINHVALIEMHRDHRMYEWQTVTSLALRGLSA